MEYLLNNKSREEIINGTILLVDKPYSWSSFDVVKKIRNTIMLNYKIKKIKVGHAGTLDPLATGLLVICTGKKTKEIESFQGQEKEYTGTFVIGETTPSFDLETEIDNTFPIDGITEEDLQIAVEQLTGEITQYPPVFSAVKIKGKRAYESARKGEEVKMNPRIVNISKFEIDSSDFPRINFTIICSKGTYIRTIVSDFGKILNNGAHLSVLRRERIGKFIV